MKKLHFFRLFIFLLSLIFFTACKKDSTTTVSCDSLKATYTSTSAAYNSMPNQTTCNNYKAAIKAYLAADCLTDPEKQQLQVELRSVTTYCP